MNPSKLLLVSLAKSELFSQRTHRKMMEGMDLKTLEVERFKDPEVKRGCKGRAFEYRGDMRVFEGRFFGIFCRFEILTYRYNLECT